MKRLDRALSTAENALAALAFAIIVAVAFTNVLSRYVFGTSLAFTTEITVNLVVWMTMIGAVIGVREGSHLGFSLLHEKLRGRAQDVVTVLIGVAMVLFFLVLIRFGWDLASQQMDRGRATPSMGIPQWLFTVALPVGSALGAFRAVQATWRQLTSTSDESSDTDDTVRQGPIA